MFFIFLASFATFNSFIYVYKHEEVRSEADGDGWHRLAHSFGAKERTPKAALLS